MVRSNPKLAKIDLSKLLTPAASLRPGAAQTCVQKQDHGLDTGLDPQLLAVCSAALPDAGSTAEPQAVYAEMQVLNTHRCAWLAADALLGGGTGVAGEGGCRPGLACTLLPGACGFTQTPTQTSQPAPTPNPNLLLPAARWAPR